MYPFQRFYLRKVCCAGRKCKIFGKIYFPVFFHPSKGFEGFRLFNTCQAIKQAEALFWDIGFGQNTDRPFAWVYFKISVRDGHPVGD